MVTAEPMQPGGCEALEEAALPMHVAAAPPRVSIASVHFPRPGRAGSIPSTSVYKGLNKCRALY